jgi:alkanesulfonate monooxygenase SsuD/methylene tetrahydromethanopterin reductase-like flavin-dependent oxidoreductase (luciferase family)
VEITNPRTAGFTRPTVGIHADEQMFTGPLPQRRALLERARRAGLDHVFVADHVSFHTGFGMDGLVRAATLAALEPELAVHIGVYLLALRHPVPVARQIATLCESAPGRLLLGVGVGGEDRHEIEICGVDPKTRGRRTDASLAALRELLRGEPASHSCEFFSFERAWIRPAPDPPVPIVVGGRSSAALRRAGRLGDGWLGVWCSPRRYAEARVEVEAEGSGRSVTWRHGLQVWVGLDPDSAAARERLSRAMEDVYRIPSGAPERIADFLAGYAAAGARDFNVMAVAASCEAAIDGVAEIRERLAGLRLSG